jgi:hypothetical protein
MSIAMQTRKCRATPMRDDAGRLAWIVTHPHIANDWLTSRPHDCAAHMIRDEVVPASLIAR